MKTFQKVVLEKGAPPNREWGRWLLRETAMSPGLCSRGEGRRRLLPSRPAEGMRSPGTAPAAAARTRPRFGERRCQAQPPGDFPSRPSGGEVISPAHDPITPPSLGHAPSAVPRRRSLRPPPWLPPTHFLPRVRDTRPWPRPSAPPLGLKRLGLSPPRSRAPGVGRC